LNIKSFNLIMATTIANNANNAIALPSKNSLSIHEDIKQKLSNFLETEKIPNILFHGQSGSGKRIIVNNFIIDIYKGDKELIKNYVMYVNCAHGKGIKFIREELKFFAKTNTNTHITTNGNYYFKTIILSNADKLTIDAQSALRRCIELFSTTTRFFVIVEDKYKLLKPILSRLCDIYIPEVYLNNKKINLCVHNITNAYNMTTYEKYRENYLKKELNKYNNKIEVLMLHELTSKLYERGYSGIDIMKYIEKEKSLPFFGNEVGGNEVGGNEVGGNEVGGNEVGGNEVGLGNKDNKDTNEKTKYKYKLLLTINKIKSEFRNEKILIFFILHFLYFRSALDLENISFM